ncbi:MAG: glycoside hydrolase family 3 protein [Elusimicrobiaceae bacterium]|nr:glycoside hydrolase family 3 protein [Elusimicrobiaceae bacterium]
MRQFLFLLLVLCSLPLGAVTFEELTPEEKLGQTLVVFVDVDSAEAVRPVIEQGKIGGVLIQWGNYSLEETQHLIDKLQGWAKNSPHKVPLLVSIDYEGGTVYTPITLGFDYLPTNMMFAAAQDEEGAATIAYLAGKELKRAGVHINFSPVLDINSNPRNPIIGVRSFGSRAQDVSRMGMALLHGFKAAGIVPMVKHFPGHGDTAVDSHYAVPVVQADLKQLEKENLKPFQDAIDNQVEGIMTGHVMYPALDGKDIATFSKPILHDLLRGKMKFKGLIVTDSLDMKGATSYCTISGCALRALGAGADIVLLGRYIKPARVFNEIFAGVTQQHLTSRIEESSRRVFEFKRKLGLLSVANPFREASSSQAYQTALSSIGDKAVTLVRDRVGLLPFSWDDKKRKPTVCAVFFAPARFADQLMSLSRPFLEKGWKVRSYNAALTPQKRDLDRASQCAKEADLLIVTSLQWADKVNSNQKHVIDILLQKGVPSVLVSTMSPYDIAHYPQAATVLATYGLNKYVLQTTARIILGEIKPQGKMPVVIPGINENASGK